jgi:phage tail-like protein
MVLSAASTDHRTVVVTFDEVVQAVNASAGDDALNPSNYTITRMEAPSVAVEVVEVRALTTSSVELVLNIPITRGCLYVVAVSNVLDAFGNVIEAPWNVATFTGYACPSPSKRRFDLWDAIPDINKDADVTRDLYKFISLIQEPVDLQLCDIDRWTDILDVDTAPERFLDLMLYGLGNPFNFVLNEVDKRRLIRVLPTIYSLKGTAKGIVDVVRFFLALEITIDAYNASSTWVLGVSELGSGTILGPSDRRALYSFDVVSAVGLTDAERARIREIVEYMKPAHTHLIRIVEPTPPIVIDHLELGFSELGVTWILH